ncbi:LURP-one-related/scramblase family protein [Paenisporosarcina cavernae]|uniref:LURP-one-related family protein n=1 Tax=Paenisporosarcina cavernae TaxID=2320858 RepID=A0A385YQ46_9BACL|nr:LURP-one-related family protein [Paenisporosarcina cavernae]AYC28470.1 hypothetical protein D3873_00765 [Paenisporosarcina cavernae]
MKTFYMKEKVFSLSGKFTVIDESEQDVYSVQGSFMKIPKTFSIFDRSNTEVANITKKTFSWLPTFYVEVERQDVLTIKKEFSFLKSRYTISGVDIDVQGNWWDMDFEMIQNGEVIGRVSKEWFTWGDSYRVELLNEELEKVVIAIVVAIDCVKADEAAANSSIHMHT